MNRFNSTRSRTLRTTCLILAGTMIYGAPAFAQAADDTDVVVVTGAATPTEPNRAVAPATKCSTSLSWMPLLNRLLRMLFRNTSLRYLVQPQL